MTPRLPPVWAEVFGEDDYGIFAECSVKEVRFVWRWICPGKFMMGCDPEDEFGFKDEKPQHEVIISKGFWLAETPVTQSQWQAVMGTNPSYFKGSRRPVESVGLEESLSFAAKLSDLMPDLYPTLPTEAQWEYSCRAGTQSAFSDGSLCTLPHGKDLALDRLGWFDKNCGHGYEGTKQTHEVKCKEPNAWGLYDMHGNVWEWCQDAWDNSILSKPYKITVYPETKDADKSANRVLRGGSWDSQAKYCRAAFRGRGMPSNHWIAIGLRLAAGQNEPRAAGSL